MLADRAYLLRKPEDAWEMMLGMARETDEPVMIPATRIGTIPEVGDTLTVLADHGEILRWLGHPVPGQQVFVPSVDTLEWDIPGTSKTLVRAGFHVTVAAPTILALPEPIRRYFHLQGFPA